MAFEYYYSVSLSIVHPSADPKSISEKLSNFPITHETMAGSERLSKDGKPMIPSRRAIRTHWAAKLHEEDKIYSGNTRLSQLLRTRLTELEAYQELLLNLGQQGEVMLTIGWFSESNHSAEHLDAEVIKKCGELGLGIELNFFGPTEKDPT